MRIGINGTIPLVGQAWIPLNTSVTAANYSATSGDVLSTVGTIIGLENGPLTDQFFLQFDTLGTAHDVIVEAPPPTATLALGPPTADFGVRTFAQVNSTFSQLTGVPTSNSSWSRPIRASSSSCRRSMRSSVLVRESGGRRPAGSYVLQPDDVDPEPVREDLPGVNFGTLSLPVNSSAITVR